MKILLAILISAVLLSPLGHAGEVVTIENGIPVYNVGPVMSLARSGLSKIQQLEKIEAWLAEVDASIDQHGSNLAAKVFLGVLQREIERLSPQH